MKQYGKNLFNYTGLSYWGYFVGILIVSGVFKANCVPLAPTLSSMTGAKSLDYAQLVHRETP